MIRARVGDRVAVGVVRRVAELGRDPLLEVLGQHVLEHLGLLVDPVPRHAEVLGQVRSSSRWWRMTSSATRSPAGVSATPL